MDKLTLTKIIDAFKVASKELHRPNLACVKLSPYGQKQVKIVACDGSMLSEYTATDEELNNAMADASKFRGQADDSAWFIHRDSLPLLKIILKGTIIPCVHNVGKVEIGFPGEAQVILKTAKDAGFDKYPDTDQIWPRSTDYIEIGLNPLLLEAVALALSDDKKRLGCKIQVRVEQGTNGPVYSPIVVINGDRRGLVMPMRA